MLISRKIGKNVLCFIKLPIQLCLKRKNHHGKTWPIFVIVQRNIATLKTKIVYKNLEVAIYLRIRSDFKPKK